MPPRNVPGRQPDVLPDSDVKRGTEPDVLPDGLRRNDQPDVPADSLPPNELPPADETAPTDTRPDGGVGQHPVHDEDQEDLEPDDYEQEVEEVAGQAARRRRIATAERSSNSGDEFTAEELGPRSIPPRSR